MIRYIKGTFAMICGNDIVVENNSGIGFKISVPGGSPLYAHHIGDEITVYTEMVVKEDDISLYGFHNIESLEFFNLLTTVNGIGPKGAMAILSSMPLTEIKKAIAFGDVSAISKANGVGKKTAERLVLELKDKVGLDDSDSMINIANISANDPSLDARTEAISALITLGYSKQEATSAVGKVKNNDYTSEEYIKNALKNLF